MSGSRTTSCGLVAGVAATLTLAACGAGARQDAGEPSHTFPVQVTTATFPTSQRLAERTQLVIKVRNASGETIPNIAVTITNPRYGTAVQAFATSLDMPGLAGNSRPVWIVDRPPGPSGPCAYSCQAGGPGGAVTAYSNTWALGALAPGASANFVWGLTAVEHGTYQVRYQVAAGLNGKARAVLPSGAEPVGTFTVTIHSAPQQAYVDNAGRIVKRP